MIFTLEDYIFQNLSAYVSEETIKKSDVFSGVFDFRSDFIYRLASMILIDEVKHTISELREKYEKREKGIKEHIIFRDYIIDEIPEYKAFSFDFYFCNDEEIYSNLAYFLVKDLKKISMKSLESEHFLFRSYMIFDYWEHFKWEVEPFIWFQIYKKISKEKVSGYYIDLILKEMKLKPLFGIRLE